MHWENRFTREYDVAFPFVSAGMAMLAGPALVAAVSNAGGLGLLGTGPLPPELLRRQIREIRMLTSKPFGVNLIVENTTLGPASTAAHIEVCVEERVSPIVFFWNLPPAAWLERLHSHGLRAWATVSCASDAQEALACGLDALVVQGRDAGGHLRAEGSLLSLLPAVRDIATDTLLIAAGGLSDGRGVAAAMVLGADAICMGTRLIASEECAARADYKEKVVSARSEQTVVTQLFGPEWPDAPMRVIRNRVVEEGGPARPGVSIGETVVFGQHYVLPHHSALLPTSETKGDLGEMCLAAGTSVDLVHKVEPAASIVRSVMAQAAASLTRKFLTSS